LSDRSSRSKLGNAARRFSIVYSHGICVTLRDEDESLLARFAKLAVNVNGVIIPGRSIEEVLARHSLNLVVNNDGDETFKVSIPGSATAIRYREHCLMLVTQHQLKDVDKTQVAMLTDDDGGRIITSSGCRYYPRDNDNDATDIIAFNFTEPVEAFPELRSRFFNLADIPANFHSDITLAMLLTGFPSKAQDYDLYENNRLGFRRFQVLCLPHNDQPSDNSVLRVKPTQTLMIDPDGMSGGAAFAVQYAEGGPRAYFAGIIIRAGFEDLYILKSGLVKAFLDSILPW